MIREEKEKQLNDTRQQILDVASKLMTNKGIKNTSLADIAKEVGISKGTLYYYYSSKDDIIYDIADMHLKQVTNELLSWIKNIDDDADSKEILMVVFERILSADTRGKLHLYLISDAVIGNDHLKERFIIKYKEWRTTLEEGARIVLKDKKINHEVLSHIILAALDGFTIQRMLGLRDIPLRDIAEFFSK